MEDSDNTNEICCVSNREDKRFPRMSSLCLRFSRYMEVRKAWRETHATFRHASTLVWISTDLVRRLLVPTEVGEVKKYYGNITCLWTDNRAIAQFKGLF